MNNNLPIKTIIDTNLWISFLIGKQLVGLKTLLIEKIITYLTRVDNLLDCYEIQRIW